MTEAKEKEGKSTSEQLEAVLGQLTADQIRFVIARQEFATDKEAAEAIGMKANTIYKWPDTVKEAVRLMAADGLVAAQHIRRRSLAKAMQVKVTGLDSDLERIRQQVATEIIEWEMGKAKQALEHSGPEGGAIELDVEPRDKLLSRLSGIAARAREAGSDKQPDGQGG